MKNMGLCPLGPLPGLNTRGSFGSMYLPSPASRLYLPFPPPHRRFPAFLRLVPFSSTAPRLTSMDEAPAEAAKELYSVWALPPEDVRDRIKRIMAALRSEFGGPAFEPHITVVGAISLTPDDALRQFRSACTALSRYPARVSAYARGTFFYQCVFLLIDPSPEVIETKSHACAHFGYDNSTPYIPHLSLLYADLPDEVKEKARQRVEELDKEIAGVTFDVAALALYKTDTEDKSLESWEPVEVYQLPPNPK